MKRNIIFIFSAILFIVVISSCGGSNNRNIKNPLDSISLKLNTFQNYSIILRDMDYDNKKDNYVHKYEIVKTVPKENVKAGDSIAQDTVIKEITKWLPVSDRLFKKHEKNLGMELMSKTNGKVSKVPAPQGYSNYVGNPRYGRWENQSNGYSTWHFFGQYMFMSAMFHMALNPVRRSMYNGYSSARSRGRAYYGGGTYGSGSRFNKASGFRSKWSSRTSAFKKRVRSKISRRSSRYSRSRSRSRSRGFGK